MQLFFNLLWVAVSCVLAGVWFLHRECWKHGSLRSSIALQLAALAVLAAILLPVISLNDDVQATMMLAESEHSGLRSEIQAAMDLSLHVLWAALPSVAPTPATPQSHLLAWLAAPAVESVSPCASYLRLLGTRPPPAI